MAHMRLYSYSDGISNSFCRTEKPSVDLTLLTGASLSKQAVRRIPKTSLVKEL